MKVSFTCMNSYYSPEALNQSFSATPRGLWDPESGKQAIAWALEQSAVADSLGFDFVSVSEHHYQAGMCNPNPAVLAGALSNVVTRGNLALLGPLVSMQNPVLVAEEIAMLDQLTRGRLIALLLRGTPNEFEYYNVPTEETRGRTEEAMLLIKKALTEPEPFAWKGQYYDFPVVSVWPGPTQVPHPPLYGSANSEESTAFIAEHRFGAAMSFFGPGAVARNMARYRELCDQHGWQPTPDQQLFRCFAVIGESEDHAADLAARISGPTLADAQKPPSTPSTDSTSVEDMKAFGFGFLQFTGTPGNLVEELREFQAKTGVGIIDLSFNMGYLTHEETLAQLRLFGQHVLPQVQRFAPVPA
ncbi:LLM class flavin-dependent oxidoreductase [Nocardia vaccinii]|uniref:LLM class flavin-dependent oxidoreductase n=1 Tax=Nocardia vaccinii TaxID=1822 RepID=UPI00082EBAC7|nr:LLM class flavin-dependent oxidoreductase [Nocardia vaccinii]